MVKVKKDVSRQHALFIVNTLLILFLFSAVCVAHIESKVDEYIEAHIKMGNFSGSILIAKGGKVLVRKGYGMANIELGVLNTPKTKFRLGSITKQFTAMAIMQLQEKGLLSVNDHLVKFIPDYPNGDKITIHHLLTHTSGIPNITDLPDFEKIKTIKSNAEKTIELFKNRPLEFAPGEKYEIPSKRKIVEVDPGIYDAYVGKYEFEPDNILNITKDNNHLFAGPPGQPKLEIFPVSETKFFF